VISKVNISEKKILDNMSWKDIVLAVFKKLKQDIRLSKELIVNAF